jgi:hypothetical protein
MAKIEEQVVTLAGVAPAYTAAAGGGDTFDPDADTFIHVKNGHTSPQTVTVVTPRTDPRTGLAEADVAVSVPNAGERMIGPFPFETFADPVTGLGSLTYSGVTALTLAVVRCPRPA